MLQDLISAKLISDYIIVEIPDSVNDLQGTVKVRLHPFPRSVKILVVSLLIYLECYISGCYCCLDFETVSCRAD